MLYIGVSAIHVAWAAEYFIRRFQIMQRLMFRRSSRWVLFARILWGSGGLYSAKQGVGQTFVLPQYTENPGLIIQTPSS